MDVFISFSGDQRGTMIVPSKDEANHWSVWHRDYANPKTYEDLDRAFCSLLSVANSVVFFFGKGSPLADDDITSLFQWHHQCEMFCKREIIRLKSVRMTIPTPADYAGTQTVPFCLQAVQAVSRIIYQLSDAFVTVPKIPAEHQILAASKQQRKLSFVPFHADDLLCLVRLELDAMFAKERFTMKDLKELLDADDNRTISPHIDAAEVTRPKKGEKNWSVSREEAKRILQCAAMNGSESIKEAAVKALRMF